MASSGAGSLPAQKTTNNSKVTNGISNTASIVPIPSSSMPEQSGKLLIGPGGKKEAEVVGFGLGKLRSSEREDLEKAKKYAIDQSVKYVMEKQRQAHQQQQQKVALYSQALALMARIYVGSINFDVDDEKIRTAFGPFGPIKNVNMSIDPATGNHKGFCFIEYEIPEAAHLARDSMNGKFLCSRTIKVMPVGRADSTPQAQPIIDMVMNEARQYNRIYVASVHPDISEQDLRSVFMAFGEITKCQLARHSSGKKHRGFGYIDFTTPESVREAIDGMNGFDLGGQCLKVGRCVTPPDALNYLSVGTASSALPAAAAIAAAEATARIQALEVLGSGKRSPGASPADQNGASPKSTSPTPPPTGQLALPSSGQPTTAPTRRRGFGGFAGTVPAPAIIQSLSAVPQLALPAVEQPGTPSAGASPLASVGAEPTSMAPQLVIPKLGAAEPPVAVAGQQTLAETQAKQEDGSIEDFYSTLKDEKFEPPKLVTPPAPALIEPQLYQPVQSEQQKAAAHKPQVAQPIALPSNVPGQRQKLTKKQKKERKAAAAGKNFLDRISDKAKSKTEGFDASKPASFAPLPKHLAPKDPNAMEDDDDEEEAQLAIGGPESWSALAIYENNQKQIVKKEVTKDLTVAKTKKDKDAKRKGKRRKPRLSSGPKLNTATKIAAANLAGALSDHLQTQKDEKGDEATLASQEHVQIRGNDARHLLIQKLMRTNRSSVVLLKNMVTPEGVDEYLEEEIRQECQKYGRVTDVVIVQEEETQSVKIFVRFAEPVQAEEARRAIDGRFFDGRKVVAQSYDQVLFDHDDFTG